MDEKKASLKNMTFDELKEFVISMGEKKFRGSQIFARMYKGADSFEEFTELSAGLRQKLAERAELHSVEMKRYQRSADGTRKYLFSVAGGEAVETVYMKYKYGGTVCVSCQAGCRMNCAFCASGLSGLVRNLDAGEIVDQVLSVQRDTGERISHVVFMGTGEPFDNYENVVKAVRILNDSRGMGLGARNITVSTCGLVKRFRDFANDLPQTGLAVSLHAPSDEIRRRIMPVADAVSMNELMEAVREYTDSTHRRVTFEYALIADVNDRPEHAEQLARRLKGMLCHVNLIPLNEVEENGFRSSGREKAEKFAGILSDRGIQVTVRRRMGPDISAACGQLRLIDGKQS